MIVLCYICNLEATRFTDTSPIGFKIIQVYPYCDFHFFIDFHPGIEVEITKEEYLAKLAMEAL